MNYTNQQIADKIDELIRLNEVMVTREMNAASCRTDRDWHKAHEARTAYDDKYGELMDLLRAR